MGYVIQCAVGRQSCFCSYKTEYKIVQGYSLKCFYLYVLEEILYGEMVHSHEDYKAYNLSVLIVGCYVLCILLVIGSSVLKYDQSVQHMNVCMHNRQLFIFCYRYLWSQNIMYVSRGRKCNACICVFGQIGGFSYS